MPKVLQIALCRQASIDQFSNTVSLSGLIDQIGVPKHAFDVAAAGNEAFAGPVTLVAMFSWLWPKIERPEIISVDLYLRTPKGKRRLIHGKLDINGPVPLPRCRMIVQIAGFPVDVPGTYVFELAHGRNVLAEIPLDVESIDIPALVVAVGMSLPSPSAIAKSPKLKAAQIGQTDKSSLKRSDKAMASKHYPKGLDNRQRDQTSPQAGQIREKRADTKVETLRKEYGTSFAKGFRSDAQLGTVREATGKSLHQLVKDSKKR